MDLLKGRKLGVQSRPVQSGHCECQFVARSLREISAHRCPMERLLPPDGWQTPTWLLSLEATRGPSDRQQAAGRLCVPGMQKQRRLIQGTSVPRCSTEPRRVELRMGRDDAHTGASIV